MHSTLESLDLSALRHYWQQHASHVYGRDTIARLTLATDIAQARSRLAWTAALLDLQRLGEDLPSQDLPDIRSHLDLARRPGAWLESPDLLEILRVLHGLRDYHAALSRAETDSLLRSLDAQIHPLPELTAQLQQSLDEDGQIRDQASSELTRIRRQLQQTRREIRQTLQQLLSRSDLSEIWQENLITLRRDRYVLPLRASQRGRVRGIVHDRSSSGETLFIEPLDVLELNNQLAAQDQEERIEVIRILSALTQGVGQGADVLSRALDEIGRLDGIRAGLLLAQSYHGELPELDDRSDFDLRDLRHPLLCLQRGYERIVPARLQLGQAYHQLIVTGPNTGGKTVLLKAVGLVHVMAYLGLPIPARGRCGWFDRILAVIGDEQSIAQNLSTFSAQLLRLRDALRDAGPRSLVILDELGSGTDPHEGGALGTAIAETLLARRCVSLITTHLDALKHYALQQNGVQIASMRFDIEALRPTHQLQLNLSGESHAIDIAQRLELPEEITRRARALAAQYTSAADDIVRERDRILRDAALARQDAENSLAQARARQSQAETDARFAMAERERAYDEARVDWQSSLKAAKQAINTRIRELKHGRDTASALGAIRDIDQQFQAKAPQTKARQAPAKRLPAPGDVGIFHPFRLPATVLEIDPEHNKIHVSARGKQLWGRLDQFEAQPGMQLPRDKASSTVSHPAADPALQLDLRGRRRDEAEQDLLRYLDEAYRHGLKAVSVLHGTGNGILGDMVRGVLRNDPRVSHFSMAHPEQGGAGVTELVLK